MKNTPVDLFFPLFLHWAQAAPELTGGPGARVSGPSAERERITGVVWVEPQRGLWAEPLVSGSGAYFPEAERLFALSQLEL